MDSCLVLIFTEQLNVVLQEDASVFLTLFCEEQGFWIQERRSNLLKVTYYESQA
jgi:hypothetical protein